MSDNKRLTKYLLANYERVGLIGRPVYNISEPTEVSIGFSLTQILGLEQHEQIFHFVGWLKMVKVIVFNQ